MRSRPCGSRISVASTLLALIALFLLSISSSFVSPLAAAEDGDGGDPAAKELVRAAVQREIANSSDTSIKHIFRSRRETGKGSQTKLYVETTDAMAGLLIANDDKPLPPQQMQGEMDRLQHLAQSPEDLRRKHRQEREDSERSLRIVRALPDAFNYQFDGTEMGRDGVGRPGDELVRLKFAPNPKYYPPSHVEQVLQGMNGYLLVDKSTNRLARIDGSLFRDVTFGWGLLGHLDKGGSFLVDQGECGDGSWEVRHMRLSFTGKIMMFKSVAIKSEEVLNDFRRVPADTNFAKGVEMLKAEHARLQNDKHETASIGHSQ
jgi:hypothetical protein